MKKSTVFNAIGTFTLCVGILTIIMCNEPLPMVILTLAMFGASDSAFKLANWYDMVELSDYEGSGND